jgi:hypothetical protein
VARVDDERACKTMMLLWKHVVCFSNYNSGGWVILGQYHLPRRNSILHNGDIIVVVVRELVGTSFSSTIFFFFSFQHAPKRAA